MALYCLLAKGRGPFLAYAGSLALLVTASIALLDSTSDGWFRYFAFVVPKSHPLERRFWIEFWTHDMARPLTVAMVLSAAYLLLPRRLDRHKTRPFYALLLAGTIATAWHFRLHVGGYSNVLLPAYLALVICGTVGAHLLECYWRSTVAGVLQTTAGRPSDGTGRRDCTQLRWLYCMCILQFVLLLYLPHRLLPTAQDVRSGEQMIRLVGSFEGDVLVADHGFYFTMAGKRAFCHRVAVSDLLLGPDTQARRQFTAELRQAVLEGRFAAIILDDPWWFPRRPSALLRAQRAHLPRGEDLLDPHGPPDASQRPLRPQERTLAVSVMGPFHPRSAQGGMPPTDVAGIGPIGYAGHQRVGRLHDPKHLPHSLRAA